MEGILEPLLAVLALICTVIPHELAHGYVAFRLGDPTPALARRLTLNPLRHIDPVGSILVPGTLLLLRFLFHKNFPILGWAKPIPINPLYFRNPYLGLLWVGLAGPAANISIALLAAGLGHGVLALVPDPGAAGSWFLLFLSYLGLISFLIALFNLLPIPPLDGSRALAYFLPPEARRRYLSLERLGIPVLLALLYLTPLLRLLFDGAWWLWRTIGFGF